MKKLNPKHEIFIKEMILHGDRIKAYRTAYPKAKNESAKNAACQLMQNTYIANRIKDRQEMLEKETTEIQMQTLKQTGHLQVELLKQQLDTLTGMKDLIAQIIGGDIQSEKILLVEGSAERFDIRASVRDIVQTLNLNFRMLKSIADSKGNILVNNGVFINGEPFN